MLYTLFSSRFTAGQWDTRIVSLFPVRKLCTSSLKRLAHHKNAVRWRYSIYILPVKDDEKGIDIQFGIISGGGWWRSSSRALLPWPPQVGRLGVDNGQNCCQIGRNSSFSSLALEKSCWQMKIIIVHQSSCTRTGYLICRYLIQKCGVEPKEAVSMSYN